MCVRVSDSVFGSRIHERNVLVGGMTGERLMNVCRVDGWNRVKERERCKFNQYFLGGKQRVLRWMSAFFPRLSIVTEHPA